MAEQASSTREELKEPGIAEPATEQSAKQVQRTAGQASDASQQNADSEGGPFDVPELSQDGKSLDEIIAELESIKNDYVTRNLDWYKDHSRRPMILFRSFGAAIILLSVSVPLLSTLPGIWSTAVLPIATLAIAGLTGINTFFDWQTQWKGHRQTEFALEHLLTEWDLEIVQARSELDEGKGVALAIAATRDLIEKTREATVTETGQFFAAAKSPQNLGS